MLHISVFVNVNANHFVGPPEECSYLNELELAEEASIGSSVENTSSEEDDSLKRNYTPINIDTTLTNQNSNIPLPSIIKESVEYDPIANQYILTQKIGNSFYSNPKYLTLDEYLKFELDKSKYEFWDDKVEESSNVISNLKNKLVDKAKGLLPEMYVGGDMFDRLFGGSTVDIRPQGNVNLDFGGQWSKTDRPDLAESVRQNGNFNFDMDINMNMLGQIGDKMKLDFNYNTLSSFDFDNNIKLDYSGTEDEIIQKIEAGNVSMPLPTLLIPGSQTLFGLKTKLKFGRMSVTSIASTQRSQNKSLTIEGGAQKENFEVWADQYEENRHFFLGHNFRESYNKSLELLPYINSPYQINNVEVWVTNDQRDVSDVRNIVALMDLGEKTPFNENITSGKSENNRYPDLDNYTNSLYNKVFLDSTSRDLNSVTNKLNDEGLVNGLDYIVTFARKLNPSEYTLNPQLGFVSLNINLQPDQVVAVSYEYAKNNEPDSRPFRVGELANRLGPNTDEPNVIFTKLLKAQTQSPQIPIWDLMMKNIYSLGAYQVENEDFRLDVYYQDPGGGAKRYLPTDDRTIKAKPVIQLVNLDNLNANNERVVCEEFDEEGNLINTGTGDGIFDFVEGLTIIKQRGRLMFPVLEPFGADLKKQFTNKIEANKYTFQKLYDSTRTLALQVPKSNRFIIRGTYKSKLSSNIRLNAFNLAPGSVTVRQGGQILVEDRDYQINYSLGTIQLLNDSYIQSGIPINISYESPDFIGFNLKSLYGTRLDYQVNEDFALGGTIMHLSERPFTQKVNYGDDPIANTMMGLDLNYFSEAPGITKFIDKIPFINTKEKSNISIRAEAARFAPGHPRAITKSGQVFIDDFEGSTTFNDVSFPFTAWRLASTPTGATDDFGKPLFPESAFSDNVEYGYNRARLNWYQLESTAFCSNRNSSNLIPGFGDECGDDYVREVSLLEIFPLRDIPQGQLTRTRTFDLSYYPEERGPYNFNVDDLEDDGRLKRPEDRWGGIMRSLRNGSSTDFEASNTEFIQFWMMDPFIQDVDNPVDEDLLGGSLYFNLGEISEDILKDNLRFGEHSIDTNVTSSIDTTNWGAVPLNQISNIFALSTDPEERTAQDVGLDGLSDQNERAVFEEFLNEVNASNLNALVKEAIAADPSNDNYNHFRDQEVQGRKILDTYKNFNNPEGNSPVNNDDRLRTTFPYSDTEDLNEDNTLNTNEAYFEYRVDLFPGMEIGDSYINNIQEAEVPDGNGGMRTVKWYSFQIPIQGYTNKVGPIADFRSIRFMRMFLTDFKVPVTMRFEGLDLVRNQWRRYLYNLREPGEIQVSDSWQDPSFNVTSVSLEQNASREPIPYVLPPGIIQEQILGNFGANVLQNEQSMAVQVCGLSDGDARAVFKTLNFDFREFKRLKLMLHAEEGLNSTNEVDDGDVTAFVRIGTDFTQNYYEYEVPLKITKPEEIPTTGTNADTLVRQIIWPEHNMIDVALDSLIKVKRRRNVQNYPKLRRYTESKIDRILPNQDTIFRNISVVGTPDLGIVRTIMLGIRNPDKASKFNNNADSDDGLEKCVEVWFNEFALSEFDESDGYAAIATVDMKLADWGNLVLSGNMHTDGFGTLEQKVNERFKDTYYEYDGALNLELGKFFPKESGIKIPFRADYSRSISDPEFDPYETDIRFDDSVDDEFDRVFNLEEDLPEETRIAKAEEASKQYRKNGKTVEEIKSINFTNVRKVKTNNEKKPRIYDIENWNATYAYTEQNYRDPIIEAQNEKTHFGSLGYNYSLQPKYITPFKKLIKSDSKWLALIKDFNFNPIPNTLSFRTDVNRTFEEIRLRDLIGDLNIKPTYNKNFIWGRNYNLRYDLSKALSIDYNATNSAKIDEPCGEIDTQAKKDSLRRNILALGRDIDFRQGLNVRYKLPLDKLPLTDWIDVKAQYANTYGWQVGPFAVIDSINLGNTISNTRDIELKGDFKLRTLYNKIPFLKQLDGRGKKAAPKKKVKDKNKKEGEELAEGEEPQVPKGENKVAKGILKVLTGIKQVSVTYRDNSSTSVPGFMDNPQFFGQNFNNNAPGLDFVFGKQPNLKSWLPQIGNRGWLTPDTTINFQVLQNQSQSFDARATLEPINDLKIDLNAKLTYSRNHSEWFKKIDSDSDFQTINPIDVGSYSISYVPVKTLFKKIETNRVSETFNLFEENRKIIAERLAGENQYSQTNFTTPIDSIETEDFFEGYGPYSQDVLIPAFMAAYTGQNVQTAKTNPFTYIPLPNWRLTYNGLNKIGNLREVISNFSIKHGYSSTYTVNNYRTNQNFDGDVIEENQGTFFKDGQFLRRDFGYGGFLDSLSGNFYSLYDIPAIVLTESFAPLIGFDISLKNGFTSTIDYKKSRNLALSFIDYQLIETRSEAITFGMGYRWQDLDIDVNLFGRSFTLNNDLNFVFDFTYRNDITMNYRLDQEAARPTQGAISYSISPRLDYVVNDKLNASLYYERMFTKPYIPENFPNTNTRAGLRLTFTLAQ